MEMLEMTVLTLNVWGIPFISSDRAVRMEAITTELASGKYDIVSLQEVWSEKDCQLIQEGTALALPYSHYFHSGVMGAGLLVLSKFPIVDTLFHAWSVNGYFHRIQHADWFGGKGVGLCRILIQNRIVNLYTAHLHAEYDIDNDDYKTHRVIQAFDTAQFISATRGKSILQILAGDLNTKPDEVTYNVLLYNSKMEDCCAHETFATNECHHNSYTSRKALERNPAGIRIDHIFMRAAKHVEAQVVDYTLPFPDRVPGHKFSYSDHEAVMARIKLIINPDAASTATSSPRGPVNQLVETATSGDNHSAAGDGQCAIDELNPSAPNGDHPLAAVAAAAFICSQNSDSAEQQQQQLGASDSQRLPRHLSSLHEAISLCERSLQQLNLDRIFYYSIGFFLFCLLIILAEIKLISGLKTLFLIIKLIVFGMILFCIFMGSIWNFMERNGILSGKKSMEIILKHNEKALHMKAN